MLCLSTLVSFVLTLVRAGAIRSYLDDQISGWTIEDTTIDGAFQGIVIGGGRRNRVRNNRFANVKHTAIELQDRGLDSESAMCKSTAPHSISSRVKELLYPGKKTPFLRHFILKIILLPRQAWDKQRKS